MNKLDIEQILFELYSVDPSLRAQQQELRSLLEKMVFSQPDIKVDQAFAQNLRQTLLSNPLKQNNFISYFSNMLKKPVLIASAATLGIAVLVSVSFWKNDNSDKFARLDRNMTTLSFAGELPSNAFGPLLNSQASAFGSVLSKESVSGGYSLSREGGEVISPMAVSEPAVGVGNNSFSSLHMMDKMIAPPYYNYTYQYTGEPLNLTETESPVFRRIKDTGFSRNFAQTLIGKDNGMIDLSKFDNTLLQNFQIAQNKDDGYFINVDLVNGSVNINPQYELWYTPCYSGNCESPRLLTEKDIPSNDEIIGIANKFLDQFGISRESYGKPVVDENWKSNYPMPFAEGMARDTSFVPQYIPDVMSVIYPLIIEGQKITESNGVDFGLHVSVDIRKMKAQGLWNLFTNKYEKSNYEIETDANRILKIAQRSGSGWYQNPEENTRTLNLGTPEKIYILHYQYIPQTGISNELYIPALKFPVTNIPTDQTYFYQKFIIVPLVKEILPQYEPQPGQPPVTIMPLTKEIVLPSAREVEVRN